MKTILKLNRHQLRLFFMMMFLTVVSIKAQAQDVSGIWTTYDNETNEAMSQVELCIRNGKLYGTVIKVLADDAALCTSCKGDLKNKPVKGMEVVSGFSKSGDHWIKKKGLLDPKSGFVVDGDIWLETSDVLKVKGKIGFISATQTWKRVK